MPSILLPEDEDAWLDPKLTDIPRLIGFLTPYPADRMQSYAVSVAVNSPKNDSPELIKPISR